MTSRWRPLLPAASLVAFAFAVRMTTVLVHGSAGLGGVYGYDAGVYYAASDSLLQGKLPYRDFVLLHPPGLPLVLTPFAALGRLTSDHTGYVVANLVFVVLASGNAGLVYGVARRLGAGRRAAMLGGAFYAVWFGAILAEVSLRLEPLAASAALLGVFVLARPGRSGRATFAGGALLAFAACVKIWWAAPVIVVLVLLVLRHRQLVRAYLAGVAATTAVIVLPFFVAAPDAMWRMVVRDQIGRAYGGAGRFRRLEAMTSLTTARVTGVAAHLGLLLALVLVVALVVRASRTPPGRAVAAMFLVQAAILVLSPTYFAFYGGYLAPGAALLVAMGATAGEPRRDRAGLPTTVRAGLPAMVTVVAATVLTAVSIVQMRPISKPFPRAELAPAVAHARCVGTDSPIALIQLNVLTRNLRNGCPNWVDVTGRTYDADSQQRDLPRRRNPQWQADILRYLGGNDVALVIRRNTNLSAQSRRTVRTWPVVQKAGKITIRKVTAAR